MPLIPSGPANTDQQPDQVKRKVKTPSLLTFEIADRSIALIGHFIAVHGENISALPFTIEVLDLLHVIGGGFKFYTGSVHNQFMKLTVRFTCTREVSRLGSIHTAR